MIHESLKYAIDTALNNNKINYFYMGRSSSKPLTSLRTMIIIQLRLVGVDWNEIESVLEGRGQYE